MSAYPVEQMPHVLLVEDSEGDIRLTREAFRELRIPLELRVARDGEEALTQLRRDQQEGRPEPALVLLDLNLPKLNGRQVLEEMKKDAKLRHIPVIVLSTSAAMEDVRRSYDLYANCYIRKPFHYESFISVIRRIEQFWLHVANLPSQQA